MANTHTTNHGFLRAGAAGDTYPATDQQADVDLHEALWTQLADLVGSGVFRATDWNLAAVPGEQAIQVSAGAGFIGPAGSRKLSKTADAETLDDGDGVTLSATNYVFRVRGTLGDPDGWGSWSVNTTGTPPANSELVGIAVLDGTEVTSVDNAPAARVNLDGLQARRQKPEAHTADDTLTAIESGTAHTNAGASGAVTLTLPPATPGLRYTFFVLSAQELRINPDGTETVAVPSSGAQGGAGHYMSADAVGEWAEYRCFIAGQWERLGYAGTWTEET